MLEFLVKKGNKAPKMFDTLNYVTYRGRQLSLHLTWCQVIKIGQDY